MAARGRFITFEGGEGAGKSTQIGLLAASLRALGVAVELTREPGGSEGAEAIRALVLGRRFTLDPLAEALLFAAARADHVRQRIEPALAAGRWVLCDRFIDSTRAYQGAGSTVPALTIATLERLVVGDAWPDCTVILDLDPELGRERLRRRRGGDDRFEAEPPDFHRRVRAAFQEIAAAEPQRCVLIDADASVSAAADAIFAAVAGRLPLSAALSA